MNATVLKIFAETTKLDSHQLVAELNTHLGPTLVAALAGVRDSKASIGWAKKDGPTPRAATYERLLMAHRVFAAISTVENQFVARAWFIGRNPRLDEQSPIMKLREGDLAEVQAACTAFIEGTDG